jgi:rhodanese-related sulfurtransferase
MTPDLWKFAQDNILLIAVALVSGGMLLWPAVKRGSGGDSVGTLEATLLMNQQDAAVVDLRDPEEFAKGHIVNARNVPAAQLETRLRELEKLKRRPVILCCERGNRSGSGATLLRKGGFDKVFTLAGGLDAWRQAGLPLEKA